MSKAPVHFIWVGPLNDDKKKFSCKMAPSSLAKIADDDQPIYMWVEDRSLEETQKLFTDHPKIQIKSLDAFLSNESPLIHLADRLNQIKQFIQAVETFHRDHDKNKLGKKNTRLETCINISKKDIYSILLMIEFGGCFCDTTGLFYRPPQLHLENITDFKLLRRDTDLVLEYDGANTFDRFDLDIWAFLSPENNTFFNAVLDLMLTKENYSKNTSKNFIDIRKPAFVLDAIEKVLIEKYSSKNKECHSYFEKRTPAEGLKWFNKHIMICEDKTSIADGAYSIPELGYCKLHTSSWKADISLEEIQGFFGSLEQNKCSLGNNYSLNDKTNTTHHSTHSFFYSNWTIGIEYGVAAASIASLGTVLLPTLLSTFSATATIPQAFINIAPLTGVGGQALPFIIATIGLLSLILAITTTAMKTQKNQFPESTLYTKTQKTSDPKPHSCGHSK